MAHQWFGNLVTMGWWDDLWLNEGFASWMESRMSARMHPEWQPELNAIDVREGAMARDALAATHPVVQRIETVEQASQAFDEITYRKGEAVIRMLERYVGEDAWRAGVRDYIARHAYANTSSDDLWRSIERAAGKPLTGLAHDFTLQPGVPLVRVGAASCVDGRSTVRLEQAEFAPDRPDKVALTWRVPVLAQGADGAPVAALLAGGVPASVTVPGCAGVLINAGQSGYFRTLYTADGFGALAGRFATLAPIDQLGLMADSWALGMAGQQPLSDFLDLTKGARADANARVWARIAASYAALSGHLSGDPQAQRRFADFASARLNPMLARLGWSPRPGEAATDTMLREQLIGSLGDLADSALIAEARRRYALKPGQPDALPDAMRKTVMGVVAQRADGAAWDQLRALAQAEKSPMTKDQLYDLLASPADAALAKRALELALTSEPGSTNSASMIARVADSHPDLAFEFAVAHLDRVKPLVDTTSHNRFFTRLAAGSANPATIDKVRAFADAHLAPGARADAETSAAAIRARVKYRAERLAEVDAWLRRQ